MAHIHSDRLVSDKKKALLIAIENVRGFPTLYHAQRDAEELRRLLIGIFNLLPPHAS